MPNILIIPDVHHKTQIADAILKAHERHIDYIVFLGDYFDDFGDTPEISTQTAKWLKESLARPNRIHLIGNHDLHYRYWRHPYMQNFNAGWSAEKARATNTVLTLDDWAKLKWFHHESTGNWLFSHAGLHPVILPPYDDNDGKLKVLNALICACAHANCMLDAGDKHPVFLAGKARGGNQSVGGLVWLDWNEEFVPFQFQQIVGHTPIREPQVFYYDQEQRQFILGNHSDILLRKNAKLTSWNLDTHLQHYAIINNNTISIYETGSLKQDTSRPIKS